MSATPWRPSTSPNAGGVWLENEQVAHRFFQDLTERQLTQAKEALVKARTVAADTGALQHMASASKA